MNLPFSIDNQTTYAAEVLRALLAASRQCPVDIATAYFSITGWKLLHAELPHVGALRLLLGSQPATGADIGLRPEPHFPTELAAMPFNAETLRLVEDLIAFLRTEKVQVRLFGGGFLHAKAYLFHQDRVGPANYDDRLRPYAAMVGSSNFTGPGLVANKELNILHRVFTEDDEPTDIEAAQRINYLASQPPPAGNPVKYWPQPREAVPQILPASQRPQTPPPPNVASTSPPVNLPPAKASQYQYQRNLPHIQPTGKPLFVTFRTAKGFTLPESLRSMVLQHCLHDHGTKMTLHAAVVMPDHVHLILTLRRDPAGNTYGLSEVMNGIKGASAHSVNKALGRQGRVWQDESFDHVLRSHESLDETIQYLRQNPVRKGLATDSDAYPWFWTEGAQCGTSAPCGTAAPGCEAPKDASGPVAPGWEPGKVPATAEGGCEPVKSLATAEGGCATKKTDTPILSGTVLESSGMALIPAAARRAIKSEVGARAVMELENWFSHNWRASTDFKPALIDLLNKSKFGQFEYSPYQIYLKALYEYLQDQLGAGQQLLFGRSAIDLAEFQDDSVKRARRILQRYDGVLIADSVGLGKTWIGKKLLEDYAYHQRMKAVVICPASLRPMWVRELAESTISARVLSMEEMGREGFDPAPCADADVILVDESHNFRSASANRYLALDDLIQRRGGRGREGARKKLILLSATPINNDLYDLLNQIRLFTQNEPDYFREAGIGDINAYFRNARRVARTGDQPAGELLFNLLDEIVVRNTRPYIRAAYPHATIGQEPVSFPQRQLHTIEYSLEAAYSGVYRQIVQQVEGLSFAPYQLEAYKKSPAQVNEFEKGREEGLVGIFKVRFLKRLESSIAAFRLSLNRALVFEQVYLDLLLSRQVIASRDFWKMLRLAGMDEEDELGAEGLAEKLESVQEVKSYLAGIKAVDLNQYDLRRLVHDVERDLAALQELHRETAALAGQDAKLSTLKNLLAGELRGQKVLIFTSYKDTARYLFSALTEADPAWHQSLGTPHIRRIDSGNSPDERMGIVAAFAPEAMGGQPRGIAPIDILISTDVLSEGQNLQDCGVMVNYDLTWNPIRLVQRSGRIDRLRSKHTHIQVWNMFPEKELEGLLHLIERLHTRITRIDELGMLDASILGEVVHPRTFNTLRRVHNGDVTVLDDEESRAELAGPELLLKDLKEMLGKEGAREVINLPDGIHSGLRRQQAHGIFFYFKAPRHDIGGFRHFWRYIDAKTHAITDNRFQIAQLIACRSDEPRYIGTQDVFVLQEKVIASILQEDQSGGARAILSAAPDQVQRALAEDLKIALRRGTVERAAAKNALQFLDQPAGKALLNRLRNARKAFTDHQDDQRLANDLLTLAQDYLKPTGGQPDQVTLRREDLRLVCFEYLCQ